jgi:hypothetical protein
MRSLGSVVLAASAAVLLVMATPRVPAASGNGERWMPVLSWQGSSLYQFDKQRLPSDYDPVLLALGRSVYADLQRARQAALDREPTNLRVAIEEAGETVHRLQGPAEATPLEGQLQIIRNDLRDRSKELDEELWVPVEAEVDAVLVYAPEPVKARTHERVAQQLDVVTSSLQYSLGVFPLQKVKRDLDAAHASASLAEPDWTGALEAVQSALATFHWFTRVPAHALLSACNDVVSAYVLAAGPVIGDDQQWKAIDYLAKAESELDSIPDGKTLAGKARKLIDSNEPQAGDIRSLLNDIQSRIRSEQQRAEVQYWKSIGPGTPE